MECIWYSRRRDGVVDHSERPCEIPRRIVAAEGERAEEITHPPVSPYNSVFLARARIRRNISQRRKY